MSNKDRLTIFNLRADNRKLQGSVDLNRGLVEIFSRRLKRLWRFTAALILIIGSYAIYYAYTVWQGLI